VKVCFVAKSEATISLVVCRKSGAHETNHDSDKDLVGFKGSSVVLGWHVSVWESNEASVNLLSLSDRLVVGAPPLQLEYGGFAFVVTEGGERIGGLEFGENGMRTKDIWIRIRVLVGSE
jgi:hypothetical protein